MFSSSLFWQFIMIACEQTLHELQFVSTGYRWLLVSNSRHWHLCTVLRMALAHPTSKAWLNHTQPVHNALLLPNGLLLPRYVGDIAIVQPNRSCLLSWLHNVGTSSPLASGQQKLFTPSVANWTAHLFRLHLGPWRKKTTTFLSLTLF